MEQPPDFYLKEIHTRFLYPFFFDGEQLKMVSGKLRETSPKNNFPSSNKKTDQPDKTADDAQSALWQCALPHGFYQDEVLPHVNKFLFAGDATTCEYLKVSPEMTNLLFRHHHLTIQLSRNVNLPIKFIPKLGIELFMTAHGVGVLSIALTPEKSNLSFKEAIDFNYRLARFDPMPAAELGSPHPQDDAERWARIPESAQASIAPPPSADASFIERLAAPGGVFTLPELIEYLLEPIREFRLEKAQTGLSIYTVARLNENVNFDDSAARAQLSHLLSALAQIEESGHAGSGNVGVTNAILNQKHWAAVGLLGAAHLVADQSVSEDNDGHGFNEQRVPRIRDKYFIPHLIALIQRLFLDQTIRRATNIITQRNENASRDLNQMRDSILQFAVAGHFVQISSREALHRFYRIAQQGLDVPDAWTEVRYAIADLDRKFAAEREHRLAEGMVKNLVAVNRVQQVIHVIEYVVVGTYTAEVWHTIFGEYLKEEFHGLFMPISTAIAFFAGLAFVKIVNRYVAHEQEEHGKSD